MKNQRSQLDKITRDYAEREATKFDELKALDKKVKTPPKAIAYTVGTLSALILGVGMCISLGVFAKDLFALGVVVGVVGIALAVANYFLYSHALKRRKKKYGDKILSLANDIENGVA